MEAGISGKNPLVSIAPLIEMKYDIWFSLTTSSIDVYAEVDDFPWHELRIAVNGSEALAIRQPPHGPWPVKTPNDLFLPAQGTYHSVRLKGTLLDFACEAYGFQKPPSRLINIPSVVYENVNVDCLFT